MQNTEHDKNYISGILHTISTRSYNDKFTKDEQIHLTSLPSQGR